MYCNETENGWTSHIPTAGGWWEISRDKNYQYHLAFIAVASPGSCKYDKGVYDNSHDLFVALSEEEEA